CGKVSGLSPLRDVKSLQRLDVSGTKATDLSPLKGLPLELLTCPFVPERDAKILRTITTLKKINEKPAADALKELDAKKSEADWIEKVAKLPPADQEKEVLAKLKEINPGFDDKGFAAKTVHGDVVELELKSSKLKYVWPVLALKELKSLSVHGEDRD